RHNLAGGGARLLARRGLARDAGAGGHREPRERAPLQLALAGVDADAYVDSETLHAVAHATGALQRAGGRVEAHEEPIARGVDLDALAAEDVTPHVSEIGRA